jgi:aerobic carbon-monoxide dehydrogenase large subunit
MQAEGSETFTWVGKSVRRFEDRRLLTGAGQYVDDVRVPDVLSVAIYRSPYPRARLARGYGLR